MSYDVLLKHLQGQHDQSTHGRGHGSSLKLPPAKTELTEASQLANFAKGLPESWDDTVTGTVKFGIADNIAKATGLSYDAVSDTIYQWAMSSNDTDLKSLNIQEAAAEAFGTELSDWQSKKLAHLSGLGFQTPMLQNNYAPYPTPKAAVKAILTEMHAETQRQFKEQGVKTVIAYRGVGQSLPWGPAAVDVSNALESWTFNRGTARDFGHTIIKAEIPVERIVSTARTGFGCLGEAELVVIGNKSGDMIDVVS